MWADPYIPIIDLIDIDELSQKTQINSEIDVKIQVSGP